MKCLLPNQVRSDTREIALIKLFELPIQQMANSTVQYTVTQKLKPLIVRSTVTAVGECEFEKCLVFELIA